MADEAAENAIAAPTGLMGHDGSDLGTVTPALARALLALSAADLSDEGELATADYLDLYRSGAGAPSVSARYVGDIYINTTPAPDTVYYAPGPTIGAGAADWVLVLTLGGAGNLRVVASGGAAEAWLDVALDSYPAQNTGDTAAESRLDKRAMTYAVPITADGTYPLAIWPNIPVTLSEVTASTVAGTCSIKIQKGGVDINGFGTAIALTTAVTDTACTETLAEDARLTVIVSAASSLTGLYVTLKGKRTGA